MSRTAISGGRYALSERIGRGGMADVYRATDQILDRPVAVKLLREMTDDTADKERFAAEARTLAQLSHPSLVTVLDAGMNEERPFLVLELVDGPSLADHLPNRLAPELVRDLGAQLADALAYAHAAGVVHRDVKPGNVLLGRDGRARLTDFGIARLLGDATRLTKTGVTIGTAAYLAPEQVRGDPITPAVDVYSLGLVLLEALTGTRAYPGSPTESAVGRLHRPPELPDDIPADLRHLLAAMTAPVPTQRPTAAQVAAALSAPGTVPTADRTRVLAQRPAAEMHPGAEATTFVLRRQHSRLSLTRLAALRAHAASATERLRGTTARWQPDGLVVFLSVLAAILLAVWMYALAGNGRASPAPDSPGVPAGVPDRLQDPLRDLHDAVTGSS